MSPPHRRHDISDSVWLALEPHLPGSSGKVGRTAKDNRLFINAVFWILRTGSPWRYLPHDYANWNNVHRRFTRWRDRNILGKLLEIIGEAAIATQGSRHIDGGATLGKPL